MNMILRAGSFSAFIIGIGYIAIIAAYAVAGQRPTEGAAWLSYMARSPAAWWLIIVLSIVTDLLFLPVMVSLYRTLKRWDGIALRLGITLVVVFVAIDLAFTWPAFISLLQLSTQSGSGVLIAANEAAAVIASPLLSFFIILVPGVGILLISLPMLKGGFGKAATWTGIATGTFAGAAVAGPALIPSLAEPLGFMAVPASVLTLIWCLLTGMRLHRMSR